MSNPVLVEVKRGAAVESRHRGAVAVCDADGAVVRSLGDIELPVFPRSAVKAIQALPLMETGAADAYGFGQRELALACASHNGEPEHAQLALSMLRKAGRDEAVLECGTHWPSFRPATIALASSGGRPSGLHNNCSGKHAGFVCACCRADVDPAGYVKGGHWLQEQVRAALQDVTGFPHRAEEAGIDGCSIPTYAVPLRNLAHGFARMATGHGLGRDRAAAARRLVDACMAEPFLVAGTGRADTALMLAAPGRIFVKIGAEGVYCAAVPELGLGLALKCDDGASRAAETTVAMILADLFHADRELAAKLRGLAAPSMTNWNGLTVGSIEPAPQAS